VVYSPSPTRTSISSPQSHPSPQPPSTKSGGDRSAADSAPLIPSGMDGQAPHPVAVAPESLPQPPPRLETEAEDDPVVVPDASDAASSEPSKVGALSTSPLIKAEDDPVVVPDSVEPASSEASVVSAGGVVPPSRPLEAEEDPLIVPDTSEATNVGTGSVVPLLPSPPLEAEDDPLIVPVIDASSEASDVVTSGVVLTDELRDKIVKQVEYYFSDENLPTDEFMLKFVMKNKEGLGNVPLGVIASFRKMKKLVQDHSTIEAALRTSSKLVVSSNGKRVRRLHPLPCNELKDVKVNF
uniref:HTH La-type RNA-binding domain-containing protein n=1 Tax=Aegilops tauschii subsp. strangulata TaxID=200361 RepID=A0A453FJ71_AEGTS